MQRDRLVKERKDRKKTRRMVCEEIGISIIYLRVLETGKANPGREMMFRFSDYYGQDVKVLFPDLFLPKSDKILIKKDDPI